MLPRKKSRRKSNEALKNEGCTELEKYIDKKIEREFVPRIEILDKSDSELKSEIRELRKFSDNFDIFKSGLESLHEKLDGHMREFSHLRREFITAAEHVAAIQFTLDNVSANGNKGLSVSLKDLYTKMGELEKITQGARARAKFWNLLQVVIETTPILKPLKSWRGTAIYAVIFILIVNTILSSLNIDFNIISIIKWLLTFGV